MMQTAHRRCYATLATYMVAAVMGCAKPPAVDMPQANDPVAGRDVYLRRCASCHGVDGRGHGPLAPSLRTAPPDLTRLAAAAGSFPHDRIVGVVSGELAVPAHGTREMPVWSRRFSPPSSATTAASLWSSRQLENLVGYLETLQEP